MDGRAAYKGNTACPLRCRGLSVDWRPAPPRGPGEIPHALIRPPGCLAADDRNGLSTAFAGVYIECAETEPRQSRAQGQQVWFDGGRMRSDRQRAGLGRDLQGPAPSTRSIAPRKATARRQGHDRPLGSRWPKAASRWRRRCRMPPERRAMMEQMMSQMGGGAEGSKRTLKYTGRTRPRRLPLHGVGGERRRREGRGDLRRETEGHSRRRRSDGDHEGDQRP